MHCVGLCLRVHERFIGSEDDITTCCAQELTVVVKRSRVLIEVLVGRKLQSIDEDARHGELVGLLTKRFGLADQLQVSCMQIAHGRHKDSFAGSTQGRMQFR